MNKYLFVHSSNPKNTTILSANSLGEAIRKCGKSFKYILETTTTRTTKYDNKFNILWRKNK